MTITKTRVTCSDCKHVFDVELVTNAPVAVAVASMNAARCEKCGGGKLGLGGEISEGKPPLVASLMDRANWWWSKGDKGRSSSMIYSAFTGAADGGLLDIPYDPDDYSRCRKLLDLMPEWRASMETVARVYPWWKPFTDKWDAMDKLWDQESPSGKCPGLYGLMKEAEKESRKLRYKGR